LKCGAFLRKLVPALVHDGDHLLGSATWKFRTLADVDHQHHLGVAVQAAVESKGLKPVNQFIGSRVETNQALSSYGSTAFNHHALSSYG
jgi:hypothetical protein